MHISPLALGQTEGLGNTTSTPVAGVPHDYITGLNEIVNPANGALSVRIAQPYPHERNPNWPRYAFTYDSNLQLSKVPSWFMGGQNGDYVNSLVYRNQPLLLENSGVLTACVGAPGNCQTLTCNYSSNFTIVDPSGGRHAMGIQVSSENPTGACAYFGIGQDVLQGGDEQYKMAMGSSGGLWDLHGNLPATQGTHQWQLYEDVNGNFLDTTGRTAPRPVPDTTETQQITPSVNYHLNIVAQGSGNIGCGISQITPFGSLTVVKSVDLPNGQKYQFQYDTTRGLLNQITYPTGAKVVYTWNTIPNAEGVQYIPQQHLDGPGGLCAIQHDWFAITKRVVYFDGVTPAQEQDFSYTTTWPQPLTYKWVSKSTTVTTKDLLRGTQFTTVYNYLPQLPNQTSNPNWIDLGYMPVENTIVYRDTNNNLLKTATKVWSSLNQMTAQCETLPNGQTSGKFYQYQTYAPANWSSFVAGTLTNLPTDVAEYDYGTVTTPCVKPSSAPIRETVTTYASFGATPLAPGWPSLLDRPATVKTYGNGTLLSETDYAYDQTAVSNVTTPIGHDETNYGASSSPPRGNPTTVTKKCFVGTQACTDSVTRYAYDTTGQLLSVTDGNSNTTQYSYTDNYTTDDGSPSGNTNAYITQITEPTTNGVSHITQFKYGFEDGKLRTMTDENGQVTTFCYWSGGCSGSTFDPFVRLTGVSYPDTGLSTFSYSDAGPSPTVTATKAVSSGVNMVTTTTYDAIGHPVWTALSSDPDGTTRTATVFDGMGQAWKVYNPTRCPTPTTNCGTETTWGYATSVYDAFGRLCQTTPADMSPPANGVLCPTTAPTGSSSTIYSNNQKTVIDELGNQRKSQTDVLGHLTNVWEAPNNPNFNYQTTYGYDALGNLVSVSQTGGSRVRSFTYDSLSRLVTAVNPESGTINYSYDPNGNVLSKQAPKPGQTAGAIVTVNYSYDALNRLINKAYVNLATPREQFGYDGTALASCGEPPPIITTPTNLIGRRTSMCAGASGSSWSYDPMGRPLIESRLNHGTSRKTLNTGYTYNLDGSLNTLTYPSGNVVAYTVGAAGRVRQVSDSANSYVGYSGTPAVYAPTGSLVGMTMGHTGTFAGITVSDSYNNRLQPILLSAAVTGQNPLLSLCYDFHLGSAINSGPCSMSSSSTGDNGNIFRALDNVDSSRSSAYSYDSLNRVLQANTIATSGPNCWGEVYTIDAFGNLTNRAGVSGMTGCTTEPLNASVNGQNQLSILTYDAAGNVINDGNGNLPTYDAENRIVTDAGATYSYDADGFRMEKSTGTMYWPDSGGRVLTETDLSGNINEEYIFFNGARIARVDRPSGAVHYYFSDFLGSASVISDASGNVQERTYFFPYGGIVASSGSDPNHYKFTGKERDSESGLDNFGARYYTSNIGRFMTPDWAARPIAIPYADFGDPQSLNLYTYVRNDPVSRADADGHLGCNHENEGFCSDPPGYGEQPNTTPKTIGEKPPAQKKDVSQRTKKVVEIGKRIVAGVVGAVNIYVGSQKIKASAALATASTADGPAAVATGTGAAYLGVNGTGQVMTGAANLTYAITGSQKAEEAAQVLTAATTVSGAATLAKTGNVPLAAMVGNSENMVGSVQNMLESKGMMEIINSSVESFLNYISADQQQQGSHP